MEIQTILRFLAWSSSVKKQYSDFWQEVVALKEILEFLARSGCMSKKYLGF